MMDIRIVSLATLGFTHGATLEQIKQKIISAMRRSATIEEIDILRDFHREFGLPLIAEHFDPEQGSPPESFQRWDVLDNQWHEIQDNELLEGHNRLVLIAD